MLRVVHAYKTRGDSMGIYKAVRELATAQSEAGAEVHLLIDGVWPEDGLRAAGVAVHEGDLGDAANTLRALAGGNMVFHNHMVWTPMMFLPLIVGRLRGLRTVVSTHGCLADEAFGNKRLKKRLAWYLAFRRATRRYDAIVATSEQECDQIAKYELGRPIVLLPNTVAPPAAGLIDGTPKQKTIGFIGRMNPIKGVRELVEAWLRICASYPDWRLRLVGPGEDPEYFEQLRALTADAPSITIEEPLFGDDKWRFLAACEIVAVPSHTENFCYVVAEAYLAGTPVLTTSGVPWPDIERLEMGWRGAGDPSTLARLLGQALSATEEARTQMGRIGAQYVDDSFGHRAIAHKSLAAYEGLGR